MIRLRRRMSALAIAVALTVGVVAATIGASSGNAKAVYSSKLPKTINLTAVEDMTGPVSYVGKAVVEGLTLAMDHINNSQLLGGSKLAHHQDVARAVGGLGHFAAKYLLPARQGVGSGG